ncbi:MAG: hypothetical protein JSU86_18485, partial [Phycisphaerales bacterium]
MMVMSEQVLDRLARAKRQLAGLIGDAAAHLREVDDDRLVGPLIGIGIKAAELAASLGFPCPPIEHSSVKPDEVAACVANPCYPTISGVTLNYPEGYHRVGVRVGPPGSTHMRGRLAEEVSTWAARWQRALDRLEVCEVRYSPLDIREDEISAEGLVYSWQLYHELAGDNSSASEELKLLSPSTWNTMTERVWAARRAALKEKIQEATLNG